MFLALLCIGCTRTIYTPVETVHTEYKEADTTAIYNRLLSLFQSTMSKEARSDSLVDRSSETVVLNEKGDTTRHDREHIIYRATSREKELEQILARQDSVINALRTQMSQVKTDSIPVPYPVERPLSRWQQVKMDFGGMAIGALILLLSIFLFRLIRKFI